MKEYNIEEIVRLLSIDSLAISKDELDCTFSLSCGDCLFRDDGCKLATNKESITAELKQILPEYFI